MKHIFKMIKLFVLISTFTYAQEVVISGVFYPNTPIRLTTEKEGEWKVESKPIYSKVKLTQIDNVAVFSADTVGEFELSFTSETASEPEKTVKKIKLEKYNLFDEQFDESQIYDIIIQSFASKNYTLLRYGIDNLKVNYPTSEYLHKSYIKALELCMELMNYQEGKRYLEILLYEYKYSEEEKLKYIKLAYEFYAYFEKNEEKMEFLMILSDYDDEYKEKLGKYYVSRKVTEAKGINILEKLYRKNFSKQLAAFLGDYYLAKGNEAKAIEYYGNSDKVALAKLMLKRLDEKSFNELTKDFSKEELEQLKIYQENKSDLSKMQNYYRYAQNNIEKDRLELAEIYLNRIVNQKVNNKMKKTAAEKLIELYIIQGRNSKALDVYETYLDENMTLKDVENLYNKGTIYNSLNQLTKALKIFEEVAAKYPKTIWARKAQIAIFKISNKNKNI